MATTIQISENLQKELGKKKIFERETYEEVIWDLIEDSLEINSQTKEELDQARKDVKEGNFYTLEEIEKEI